MIAALRWKSWWYPSCPQIETGQRAGACRCDSGWCSSECRWSWSRCCFYLFGGFAGSASSALWLSKKKVLCYFLGRIGSLKRTWKCWGASVTPQINIKITAHHNRCLCRNLTSQGGITAGGFHPILGPVVSIDLLVPCGRGADKSSCRGFSGYSATPLTVHLKRRNAQFRRFLHIKLWCYTAFYPH